LKRRAGEEPVPAVPLLGESLCTPILKEAPDCSDASFVTLPGGDTEFLLDAGEPRPVNGEFLVEGFDLGRESGNAGLEFPNLLFRRQLGRLIADYLA
jgi:hypothetical protein